MATRGTGEGPNPLATSRRRPKLNIVEALKDSTADAESALTVRVADLAVNPDNPEARSVPDEGLVASIGQVGVLVPLIVQSRAVFVERHPEHADVVDDVPYVILAGHERRAACLVAGVDEVPYIVRDDMDSDDVMVGENLHRVALSPLEEAVTFARIMERQGLSQRKLSEHLGVPQSQISKRLALLRLPELVRTQVADGSVTIETALEVGQILGDDPAVAARFVELAAEGSTHNYRWHANQAVRDAAHQEQVRRAEAAAAEEGLPFVADPAKKFKNRSYEHQVTTKAAIAKARKAGTLAVGPGSGADAVTYYTLEAAKPGKQSLSKYEQDQRDEDRARKDAMKARRVALGNVLANRSALGDSFIPLRTQLILEGHGLNAEVGKVAYRVSAEIGLGPQLDEPVQSSNYYTWTSAVRALPLDDPDRLRLAGLILASAAEVHASWQHGTWGVLHVLYLDWLEQHGYVPTAWETAKRDKAREAIPAHATDDSPGDSAESPDPETTTETTEEEGA
jgi:ParB/RepB/Spo0J family partition protein